MEQKQPLQQMVLGDLDSYVQKNETRSPTYAIHKNKFKMDKRLKCKLEHHKSPRGKHWQEDLRIDVLLSWCCQQPTGEQTLSQLKCMNLSPNKL